MNEPPTSKHPTPSSGRIRGRMRTVGLAFLVVFLCEFVAMLLLLLPLFSIPEGNWEAAIDSALLSFLAVPGLLLLGLLQGGPDHDQEQNASSHSPGVRNRLFCLRNQYIVVLTLLSAGPIIWLSHSIQGEISEVMEERAFDVADFSLGRSERELGLFLQQMRRDAVSISQYPPIRGLLRCRESGGVDPMDGSTAAQWRVRLESLFATYGASRQDVFQVRFLDEAGQEWVRAEGMDGSLTAVSESELQDKSMRPFYRNAIHLADGHCHITDLDLNKEHGRIEVPHRPAIRVSTPVWFEGRSRGIVVINYTPRFLLGGLEWMNNGELFLASQDGGYLYHEDESKCWSNQLGTDFSIFADWPLLKDAVDAGSELTTHRGQTMFFDRIVPNQDVPNHWWVLGAKVDMATLHSAVASMKAAAWRTLMGVSAIALLVALIMAAAWGRPISHLAIAARAIEAGELDTRVLSSRSDEIGDLGRAFNGMADRISRNTEQLETLVHERTLELETQKRAVDLHAIVSIADVNGDITYANEKMCEISGYTRSELLGKNHRMIKSDEHDPEFFRKLWRTVSQGNVWNGEIKNRSKDGALYWVDATIVPFKDVTGAITQYVAIRTDISESKFNEIRLEQTNVDLENRKEELENQQAELVSLNAHFVEAQAKAELANQAKTDFLANMSHEIRTPMTAIIGFAETLRNDSDLALDPRQRVEAIDTIQRNGQHLLGLINDILDMSKIEAGKMTAECIPFSIVEIVTDAHALMKGRADAKKLALNVEYVGAIPEAIQSDPTRLRQILINLLGNAVKFTEEGGVRLIVRFVPHRTESSMQFDVMDTGVGMTPEQVTGLFKPFNQADTSTTRKFGGTGLGLTISKHFAELLGGDITIVDSTPGCGTRFRATIATGSLEGVKMIQDPAATPIRQARAATVSTEKPLDCRVLLAEDGPDNQRLISFLLERAGARTTVVENGRLAVDAALAAQAESEPFEVILMDMQMPVLDGYSATAELRERGYEGPIIALTAHAMAGDRQKCLDAGCNDYATKPVDRIKFIQLIHRYLKPAAVA